MNELEISNQTIDLLAGDLGRTHASWRIAQAQALALQAELREVIAQKEKLQEEINLLTGVDN